MGFIIDQTIVNIKLTDLGRQLLSQGNLSFDLFAVGDSEIDYEHYSEINFDASNARILRPKDAAPEILSFITREGVNSINSGETFNQLGAVVSNTSDITNTAPVRGFFTSGTTKSIISEANIAKQPDVAIQLSGVTGGTLVTLQQSITYGSNPTEPVVGDYFVVRWGNPDLTNTLGFDVDQPIPYIWYKIQEILSGTLAGNNLVVRVDKPTPNYSGYTGNALAGAVVYPNSNGRQVSGDSIQNYYGAPFITDFVSEAILAFIQNCDTPTIDVPIWNMHIVFRKDVEGIGVSGRTKGQYFSTEYSGFIQYIQNQVPTIERLGLIHYTNNSPSNNYGEGFVPDTVVVELPTIMDYRNSNKQIGMTLTAASLPLTLTGLSTTYQDLADQFGNIVGKVFLDLKMIVIEDQELLYALSYKSNRNWTLPPVSAGFNITNCPESDVNVIATVVP
jgi:hypothetical protein